MRITQLAVGQWKSIRREAVHNCLSLPLPFQVEKARLNFLEKEFPSFKRESIIDLPNDSIRISRLQKNVSQ